MKERIFFFILLLAVILPTEAQNKKEPALYVPRQYASVDDALSALRDCNPDPVAIDGRCHEDAVMYLKNEYWKGNKKILPKVMEVDNFLSGSPAEAMDEFLSDVLERETKSFLIALRLMPGDLQMKIVQSATAGMDPNKVDRVLSLLNEFQDDRKLGQSASMCILSTMVTKWEIMHFNKGYECGKRPLQAPVSGQIWGMDCGTNRLFIGDRETRREVIVILSDSTTIVYFQGGNLSCSDLKPNNIVHVWPSNKIEGKLDKSKPVEASVVLVEH